MKTRLFFILASAAVLTTSNINASNSQKLSLSPVANLTTEIKQADDRDLSYLGETTVKVTADSKVINVNLGEVKNDVVTIRIEDSEGNVLLSDKVRTTQKATKRYNVSKLEKGSYNLIVSKQTSRITQPFQITEDKLTISEIEKKEKFIPVVAQKQDQLNVNVLLGNYSNITVSIYDNTGHKVFEEKNYVVMTLHKSYNLSQLGSGVYIAEVMAGDETFYYTIEK